MTKLIELARLLKERNAIDAQISALIGRPAYAGHTGEFVAAEIFGIRLHDSATTKASDGVFLTGPLTGKSVNIKCYARMQPILDMAASADPLEHADYYLVLTGPRGAVASSRGTVLAWSIAAVYLFDAHHLIAEQTRRQAKLVVAAASSSGVTQRSDRVTGRGLFDRSAS
jgi:hypothetical protein